ncbi:MAG TPA: hypothetical protein VFG07_00955 [Thermoplasmata archaeon]|nr:hypothetical protein [Thermoplasmata archaeon]
MRTSDGAGRLRRLARGGWVLSVLFLLVGVAMYPAHATPEVATYTLATKGVSAAVAGPVNASVNATDQPAFTPSRIAVAAGTTLGLEVHNAGVYNHTFTVTRVANFTLPPTWSPHQLNAFFAANGTLVNLTLAAGQTAFANLSIPLSDAGASFEFVSLTPYQFQDGMSGTLAVAYPTSAGAYDLTTQTTDNLRFLPSSLVIPNATQFPITVSVEVSNAGTTLHTFTIEGQNNNTLLPGNYSQYFAAHPPLSTVNIPTTTGTPVWANFTITGKGAYEFICEISGHFQGGMFGWLYVGYTPLPPPPPPSSAIVDSVFLVGAGALLGIALLLTVVATFVGRFPRSPGGPPSH